jgi:hypothetical protein
MHDVIFQKILIYRSCITKDTKDQSSESQVWENETSHSTNPNTQNQSSAHSLFNYPFYYIATGRPLQW